MNYYKYVTDTMKGVSKVNAYLKRQIATSCQITLGGGGRGIEIKKLREFLLLLTSNHRNLYEHN